MLGHTLNITTHPPRIPRLTPPARHVRLAPVAQGIQNRPVNTEQRIPHGAVPLRRLGRAPVVPGGSRVLEVRTGAVGVGLRVGRVWDAEVIFVLPVRGNAAVVVFEVCRHGRSDMILSLSKEGLVYHTVNPPLGKRLRVDRLVSQTRWVAGAGGVSGACYGSSPVCMSVHPLVALVTNSRHRDNLKYGGRLRRKLTAINPNLQPQPMDLLRKTLNTARKPIGVRDDTAGGRVSPALDGPAVVN